MNCTKCGSDNTQRLEIVFEQGTHNIETTSKTRIRPFLGIIPTASAKTKTSGTSMSTSAQKAAPPQKKRIRNLVIGIILGLIVISQASTNFEHNWFFAVLGLLVVGLCIWRIVVALGFNSKTWPTLYSTWEKSWMCNKCGNMFIAEL